MAQITVEQDISESRKSELGIDSWGTWECGVEEFPWTYSERETGYILEGRVTVTPDDGDDPVTLVPGDLVVFPKGMSCRWNVTEPLRKRYCFG